MPFRPRRTTLCFAASAALALLARASPLPAQGDGASGEGMAAIRFAPSPTSLAPPNPGRFPRTLAELNLRLDSLEHASPPPDSYGTMFVRGWALVAGVEVGLLALTLMMPRSFSGWDFEEGYVKDGLRHLGEAWSKPPVWDTDHWFHNYLGHPYGGSVYYNTLRVKGATPVQSFAFAGAMSFWWEYVLEAMAERPSIQDLIITPVAGAILGEVVHRTTLRMRANGTSPFEKAFILLFNPTHLLQSGWGPMAPPVPVP